MSDRLTLINSVSVLKQFFFKLCHIGFDQLHALGPLRTCGVRFAAADLRLVLSVELLDPVVSLFISGIVLTGGCHGIPHDADGADLVQEIRIHHDLCLERKLTVGILVLMDHDDLSDLLNDVCIDDYDALAIPGGFEEYGFYDDAFSEQAVSLIKEFNDCGKMIATICVAALALGNSGILKGKRATTYHLNNGHRQKQLAKYGAIVVNEPVVRTDNIITSYCPQTGPEVAFMLLEELVGTEKMLETKIAMGF